LRYSKLGAIALFLAAPAALNTAQSGKAFSQTAKPALEWAPCGDVPDTECAGLEVPINYDDPNGAKFTLRLGRAPAVDPAKRKGVLLLLPGGPGPGIAEMMGGDERKVQHIADFQQQYDVVTWDPRGIGKSSPIRCDPKAAPTAEMPLDHKPTQAEFDAVARANATFIQSCANASGELFGCSRYYDYDPAARMSLVTFLDNHDQPRFLSSGLANNRTDRLAVAGQHHAALADEPVLDLAHQPASCVPVAPGLVFRDARRRMRHAA